MAQVEMEVPVDEATFEAYRRSEVSIMVPERSEPGDTLLVVERCDRARTGRWIAATVVLPEGGAWMIAGWPPVAMNNHPNAAAARVP